MVLSDKWQHVRYRLLRPILCIEQVSFTAAVRGSEAGDYPLIHIAEFFEDKPVKLIIDHCSILDDSAIVVYD